MVKKLAAELVRLVCFMAIGVIAMLCVDALAAELLKDGYPLARQVRSGVSFGLGFYVLLRIVAPRLPDKPKS